MERVWNVRRVKGHREYWFSHKNRMYIIKRDMDGILPRGYKYIMSEYQDGFIAGETPCVSVQEAKAIAGIREIYYDVECDI